ncbi:MAG: hypothetical protein U0802_18655 [Candidatus Binatia bacterium]
MLAPLPTSTAPCRAGARRKDSTSDVLPAGEAGNEDQLALAAGGALEAAGEMGQLRVAADERAGDLGGAALAPLASGRGVATKPRRLLAVFGVARLLDVVAEDGAQLADRLVEGVRGDGDVGPDGVEQLLAVTSDPARWTRPSSTAQVFGRSGNGEPALRNCPARRSSVKDENASAAVSLICMSPERPGVDSP